MNHFSLPLTDSQLASLSLRLRVLGDPVRLRLIHRLAAGPCGVSELSRHVGSTQPNVSKHLKVLLGEGVVGRTQVRNTAIYNLIDEQIGYLWQLVKLAQPA